MRTVRDFISPMDTSKPDEVATNWVALGSSSHTIATTDTDSDFRPLTLLSVYFVLNAQRLGYKLTELHCLLYSFNYHIILITESWLDTNFANGLLDPENKYNYYTKRQKSKCWQCLWFGPQRINGVISLYKQMLELLWNAVFCGYKSMNARDPRLFTRVCELYDCYDWMPYC